MSNLMMYGAANFAVDKLKDAMKSVSDQKKWLAALTALTEVSKTFSEQEDIRLQLVKVIDLVEATIADLGLSNTANSKAAFTVKGGANVAGFGKLPNSTFAYVTMLGTPVETLKKKISTWYSSTIPTTESGEQNC